MMKPLDILKHDHRVIEQGLRGLDGVCQRLERGERVQPQTLSQFLDFIRVFADRCHHRKEEAHLFPALKQHGVPRYGGPLGLMLHEHEMERGLVAQLEWAVQAYKNEDPEGRQFVQAARRYITLITSHMQKEEHTLFRIAEEALDDRAMAWLGEAFEQVEAGLGCGTHERYEQIAATLEKEWAG
jgi:hemerythrin-like domain-containing protein